MDRNSLLSSHPCLLQSRQNHVKGRVKTTMKRTRALENGIDVYLSAVMCVYSSKYSPQPALYKIPASESIKIYGLQVGLFVFAMGCLAGGACVVLGSQARGGDYWRGEGPQNQVNNRDDIRKSNCLLSITDVQAQFCLSAAKK